MITNSRYNAFVAIALAIGTVLFIAFVMTIAYSHAGEAAVALGGIIGGVIGASGAAVAVYLTLAAQRQEDRTRINNALVREVIEFSLIILNHLDTCENIRAGVIALRASMMAEAMEMPHPIIYPAVAEKIGLLLHPQYVVAFYTRITQMRMLVRILSLGQTDVAPDALLQGADIQFIVEEWLSIANIAVMIIQESEAADASEQDMKDTILLRLRLLSSPIDWTECAAVEPVSGKLSGQPFIKGSRVRPNQLIVARAMGEEWLSKFFTLRLDVVREVLAFYDAHARRT